MSGDSEWTCAARKQGTAGGNDPADCDWPACGCDPYANKVIDALYESGVLPDPGKALHAIAHPGSQGLSADEIERIEAEQERLGLTDDHDFGDSIETVELDRKE